MKKYYVFRHSRVPSWFSWRFRVSGITLGPFIFVRGAGDERLINHEKIHIHQQYELLFLGFWILYLTFWLIGLVKRRDWYSAYVNNPFEIEAYSHDQDPTYLNGRRAYAWVSHIRKMRG